jgi:hypothetical protein
MRYAKGSFKECRPDIFAKFAVAVVLLAGVGAISSMGQQKDQKTFSSAEEASKALYNAAKASDEKALVEILGPKGRQLISSGDAAEDAENRAAFAKRYEEMNRLVQEPDGSVTIYTGPYNWPFPIPLANKGGTWYFDTEGGEREILFRRIGRNEMSAIHICQQLVAAQKEYYEQHNVYAQKVFSGTGKKDGLYWSTEGGTAGSPIGPRVAWAFSKEAAGQTGGTATPYRGYYFEMLGSQGKGGVGGANNGVDGKTTGGFAFVAYPADYRSSGVNTFVVGTDGVLYEKDLGKKTESIAKSMKELSPDSSWQKSQEGPQQAAGEPPNN